MRNYIFISYAHKDSERVLPVIKKLRESGYNVWYDDGIDPGTEWAVNIATHIEGCAYFLAFMSQAYLDSLNCREEWNFARDEQKTRFFVYIEDVTLPSEMRMHSSMIQNLFMHRYNDKEEFYSKLFAAPGIGVCKNAAPEEIESVVAEAEDRAADEETVELGCVEEQSEEDETIEEGEERQKEDWEEYFEIEESEEGITICECIEDAEEIVIPDRINWKLVIRIGDRAFEGCENLSSVVIPKGVIEIGESAFEGCHNLSSIVIPEGVTEIGRRAFDSCFSLSNVVIPEGITEISERTFNACLSLSSVEIPKSVTVIYAPAFENCSSLSVELLDIITCEKLAMGGHEEANIKMLNKYLELARKYSDGDGVEKDENKAVLWYRKADDFGKSQCELICRYLGGEDVWLSKQKLGEVYCDCTIVKRVDTIFGEKHLRTVA